MRPWCARPRSPACSAADAGPGAGLGRAAQPRSAPGPGFRKAFRSTRAARNPPSAPGLVRGRRLQIFPSTAPGGHGSPGPPRALKRDRGGAVQVPDPPRVPARRRDFSPPRSTIAPRRRMGLWRERPSPAIRPSDTARSPPWGGWRARGAFGRTPGGCLGAGRCVGWLRCVGSRRGRAALGRGRGGSGRPAGAPLGGRLRERTGGDR